MRKVVLLGYHIESDTSVSIEADLDGVPSNGDQSGPGAPTTPHSRNGVQTLSTPSGSLATSTVCGLWAPKARASLHLGTTARASTSPSRTATKVLRKRWRLRTTGGIAWFGPYVSCLRAKRCPDEVAEGVSEAQYAELKANIARVGRSALKTFLGKRLGNFEKDDPGLFRWAIRQTLAYVGGVLDPVKSKLLEDLPGWDVVKKLRDEWVNERPEPN